MTLWPIRLGLWALGAEQTALCIVHCAKKKVDNVWSLHLQIGRNIVTAATGLPY